MWTRGNRREETKWSAEGEERPKKLVELEGGEDGTRGNAVSPAVQTQHDRRGPPAEVIGKNGERRFA